MLEPYILFDVIFIKAITPTANYHRGSGKNRVKLYYKIKMSNSNFSRVEKKKLVTVSKEVYQIVAVSKRSKCNVK
jgi:hypothetical protein